MIVSKEYPGHCGVKTQVMIQRRLIVYQNVESTIFFIFGDVQISVAQFEKFQLIIGLHRLSSLICYFERFDDL